MARVLDVRGLSVSFPSPRGPVAAVDDADFHVDRGETLAIVGESGSGKSVSQLALFDLLPASATVSARALAFEGRDLRTLSARERRALCGREMAMVMQDPTSALNPLLTVERQLSEVLETHEGISRRDARPRVQAALLEVGIAAARERLDAYPHELSGGMRQRVLIAQALLCKPKLIVADEPTTALDVTLQAQILDLFRALRDRHGLALVLITHSFGVVASCADRVLVMYAGRVVETGTVESVLARPRHPYTQALLGSVPRVDRPATERLTAIPGAPPDLARLPRGCAFEPRCVARVERCVGERPRLEASRAEPGSSVACWRADLIAEAALSEAPAR